MGADVGIGVSVSTEIEGRSMGLAYISIANEHLLEELEMQVPPNLVTIKRRISNQALIKLRKLLELETRN